MMLSVFMFVVAVSDISHLPLVSGGWPRLLGHDADQCVVSGRV